MIMTVVTAKVAVEPLVAAVQTVMIAPMILLHMDPSAVIQPGMSLVLIVPHWKAAITGIVLDVHALVTATLLLAGRLADRSGRRLPLIAGLAVSGASTAVLGWVLDPWAFLALSLVAGLGSGLVNPPLNAAVADAP